MESEKPPTLDFVRERKTKAGHPSPLPFENPCKPLQGFSAITEQLKCIWGALSQNPYWHHRSASIWIFTSSRKSCISRLACDPGLIDPKSEDMMAGTSLPLFGKLATNCSPTGAQNDGKSSAEAATFHWKAGLTINPVRRTSITSALLVMALATSSSGCVDGWGRHVALSCPRPRVRQDCARKKPASAAAMGLQCGHLLRSLPGNCGVRGFVQAQVAALHAFEASTPLRRTASCISAPFGSGIIIISAIGSPETDRGPPRS